MRLLAAIALCAIFLLPVTRAQQDCSTKSLDLSASGVKSAQTHLLAFKVGSFGMDPSVPPELQKMIRTMKAELASASDLYISCFSKSNSDAKSLQHDLSAYLGVKDSPAHSGPTPPQENDPNASTDRIYGADLKVNVEIPPQFPHLLVVQIGFDVDCGGDNILLVYERAQAGARRVLLWQSADYSDVSGAFGDFFHYWIVPVGSAGEWAVASFHGKPWCTSRFSGFDVDVVAADMDSSPKSVFHKHAGYTRDVDPVFKQTSNGFEIRLSVSSLDFESVTTRPAIYRYEVTGTTIRRVQPIAMNGRDFVDEWLASNWDDAKRWSDSIQLDSLSRIHGEIMDRWKTKTSPWPSYTFGPVRACSSASNQFQVELDRDPGMPSYFRIEQGRNSFTMLSVSEVPGTDCKGSDLMRKRP